MKPSNVLKTINPRKKNSSAATSTVTEPPPPSMQSQQVTVSQLDVEEAETKLVAELDRRSKTERSRATEDTTIQSLDENMVPKEGEAFQQPLWGRARRAFMMKQKTVKQLSSEKHRDRSPVRRPHEILESLQETEEERKDVDDREKVAAALFRIREDEGVEEADSEADRSDEEDERLPLRHAEYGSVSAGRVEHSRTRRSSTSRRLKSLLQSTANVPQELCLTLYQAVMSSYLVWFGIPLFVTAWILYYYLGNPEFEFLPGQARVSWWCNFVGRQMATLDLARLSQWIVVDCILLKTRIAVTYFSPLLAIYVIQSKGLPFVSAAWGFWDLLLLHGDGPFQAHWLYWTGLSIYSQANSGTYILSSETYLRLLVSFIIAGVVTTIKRVVVSVRFGRRRFAQLKPQFERILVDIVLLHEVAQLANQAFSLSALDESADESPKIETPRGGLKSRAKWLSVKFDQQSDISEEEEEGKGEEKQDEVTQGRKTSPKLERNKSGSLLLKNLLEHWEEPVDKTDKSSEASIYDVLKFKRAVRYMDKTYPFGEAFGPAQNRDECITSSHSVFWRLVRLTPGLRAIDFEVLSLAIADEDGSVDEDKRRALRRVFRPDCKEQLPLLAFIQSCDTIYKRLRYFQASVSNASIIDNALETIINSIFGLILILFLLSFMKFNPWPILVSITSLLVSISFALGSSASKYVEGVLLVAARRPYDLGDRITFTGVTATEIPLPSSSWFVEDINLFTTTLRYARTNEVSTVSNSSIAGSRIVNYNRSLDAVVSFGMTLHISVLDDDNLERFRSALEKYVRVHPRIWHSLEFCRLDNVDSDTEQAFFSLAFQHHFRWQAAGRILLHRADLICYVYKIAKDLGINYDSPPFRRLLYQGGVLKQGEVQDYKKNLLMPGNVDSYSASNMQEPIHQATSFGSPELKE